MSAPTPRRSTWPLVAFVLLLVVPTLEIAVIIGVGRVIGGWPTVGLLVLESAIGAWLVKREGRAAWTALQGALRSGRMPSGELSDAALVLVGGTLLLTPGFLSDVLGFACVLPPTRGAARRVLARVVARRLLAGAPGVRVWTPGPGTAPTSGGGATRQGPAYGARRPGEDDVIEGEVL